MLVNLVNRLTERGKKGYLILAAMSVMGLLALFFLDVWLLGTLAAAVQSAGLWGKSIALGKTPAHSSKEWAAVGLWLW